MDVSRVFYASAGHANLIDAHQAWDRGENIASEVSLSFSGQIASFVDEAGASALMVSAHADGREWADDRFTVRHCPKRAATGLGWYREEWRNARALVRQAKAFGADLAIVDSGVMPFFMMRLFRTAGIPLIVVLHNTLWPHGFRPTGRLRRLVERLDAGFFRTGPHAVLSVSPEAERQLVTLAPRHRAALYQVRAQFERPYFDAIPAAPAWDQPTFEMMFIGRVLRDKGVFDILDMARAAEARVPGRVRWTICGRGPDLAELQAAAGDLAGVVDVRGWTSLEDLQRIYARTHASIVPTRSGFAEGMAMTAVEAILAGRPVVTNPLVPAHEVLAPAAILGRTNDAASHAGAVIALATDRARYEALRDACADLRAPFYDRAQGLTHVLHRAIA